MEKSRLSSILCILVAAKLITSEITHAKNERKDRQLFYPQGPQLPVLLFNPIPRAPLFKHGSLNLAERNQGLNIQSRSRLSSVNTNTTSGAETRANGGVTVGSALVSFINSIPGFFDVSDSSSTNTNTAKAYESCSDSSGLMGICTSPLVCSGLRGRSGTGCASGFTCCTNVLSKCSGQVALNNTYWQSPPNFNSLSCALTVNLNSKLPEQPKPICQVRLDFISFSIAQPNAESVCNTDFFQVGGTNNKIPTICGDNAGQHMYLHAPSPNTDLQLLFSFKQSSLSRSWNIKISMLPCEANYLAPMGCLQYFTSSAGTVRSFNWKDVPAKETRQLADQDYRICFRTELVGGTNAATLCLTACSVSNNGKPFSISRANVRPSQPASQGRLEDCNNDFLLIPGGFNSALSASSLFNARDRYCGEKLNTLAARTTDQSVCTTLQPFSVIYKTNSDETRTPTADVSGVGNQGFCLNFQMSPS